MNRWRIVGLIVLALLAASLLAWWLKPVPPPAPPPQAPAREVFHSSKPLRIEVASARPPAETAWLDYELAEVFSVRDVLSAESAERVYDAAPGSVAIEEAMR